MQLERENPGSYYKSLVPESLISRLGVHSESIYTDLSKCEYLCIASIWVLEAQGETWRRSSGCSVAGGGGERPAKQMRV